MDRLVLKYRTARSLVPRPVISAGDGARVGIIAFGSSHHAVMESRAQLEAETALSASYMRLRALPFTDALANFVAAHDRVYVVEQNRDGQLRDLIGMELPEMSSKLRSVLNYDGLPLTARFVTDSILAQERS
jgi:2-oxoglutarate ferredoxin oxidoreductase subunit alpha